MRLSKVSEIFQICLTGGAVAGLALVVAGSPASAARPVADADWQIAIVPEQTAGDVDASLVPPAPEPALALQEPSPAPAEPTSGGITITPAELASPVEVNGRTYEGVYESIPFNHTEYMANPSYRHEATMEILLGQLRPMTIVKDQQPQPIMNQMQSPYQPYRYSLSERWQYHAPAFRLLDPGSFQ